MRRTGLTVELIRRGDVGSLGQTVQATIYRIVQAALTNVLKHSDHPSKVTVLIECRSGMVEFAVEDDGRQAMAPGTADRAGNGRTGMMERVAMFGGCVDSGPSTTGWRVRGQLPVG